MRIFAGNKIRKSEKSRINAKLTQTVKVKTKDPRVPVKYCVKWSKYDWTRISEKNSWNQMITL